MDGKSVLHGVTSYGSGGCGMIDTPGPTYANVFSMMNFVKDVMVRVFTYSHLSNKRDVTLTDFRKFHPARNKNPPCTFIDFITKLSIFLQNLQYSYRN